MEPPVAPAVTPLANPPGPFIPGAPRDVLLQSLLTTVNASALPADDKLWVAKALVRQVAWAG